MLRTRLFLGLFPLAFLIVATGGYAIYEGREVAETLTGDIARSYRAVVAAERMRTAATRMGTAVSQVPSGENERRMFEDSRSAFMREMMEQAAVAVVDEAFGRFVERGRLRARDLPRVAARVLPVAADSQSDRIGGRTRRRRTRPRSA
jgi:hypothetical protein